MATKIAINGFGRIGRAFFKLAFDNKDLEVVAINDTNDNATLAHLLKYDTVYGKFDHDITTNDKEIIVDGIKYNSYAEKDPTKLPWEELGVDIVLESTGKFRTEEEATEHIKAGAKRVVISAPAKGGDVQTVVFGVNYDEKDDHKVISNASCTTNCIAPVMSIMSGKFGIQKAAMTTIHSYTADQNLVDGSHSDLRRARSGAENIIPTTTGAAKATAITIPVLEGVFDGIAIRVPTPVVSLSDITMLLKKKTTVEEINKTFIEAKDTPRYEGVLDVTDEPLVSSDFIGNTYASIVDLSLTKVIDGDLAKIITWYDNEWGYSSALIKVCYETGKKL
ncbi:MAG: type I glyceraldehyde-3-phosphate dehydrogenase [Candidatus Kerfeldbacteria bacterium]